MCPQVSMSSLHPSHDWVSALLDGLDAETINIVCPCKLMTVTWRIFRLERAFPNSCSHSEA